MNVAIFGNGSLASLTWYCLTHDSPDEVVAFTVDAPYLAQSHLHDLPVVVFSELERRYPPATTALLLAIGSVGTNAARAKRLAAARRAGFAIARYVSSRALVWPDLRVHENVMIHDGAIVQPFATIAENTIVRSGAHISHHVTIEADCFLAAGACVGGNAVVGRGSFVGLNATILDNVTIAPGCTIGAGAVVVKDTQPDGTYVGVPARRLT
jgi:sugar O-acyltransferase (sialic acid O-acetyltransferase NeuD family)